MMAEFRQPIWLKPEEVPTLPKGWQALPTQEACIQLKPGKLFDNKTVSETGKVPVLSQSVSGFIGYHDEEPGVEASSASPVVTFANHTCAMRLMRHPFSTIQNIFPKVGRPNVTDTVYFYYAALGRVALADYKGHHPLFRQAHIPIPPLNIQKKIAGIMSAYDELIANCSRRISILEAMARDLYREWFVDLRFPGYQLASRSSSAQGDLPRGWEIMKLEQVAEIKGGKQLAKAEIHEAGAFPVFGGNGIQGYAHKATHQGFVIAFGRVGAYCGSIHWSYNGAWLNNNSSAVVPTKHNELVLHHLLNFQFSNLRSGAAQPFISNTALAGIDLLFPTNQLADKFCSLVKPMRLQQVILERQIQKLQLMRDLLLPRLLSGDVELRAA